MKYTQYFKKMKTEKGVPFLNFDQHSRYFNIVALEYHIDQMNKLGFRSSVIFTHLEKQKNSIMRITKELEPEELLMELIELSK